MSFNTINASEDVNIIFDEAMRLSAKAEELRGPLQTIENMILKVQEELGELATDVLKMKGYKVNSEDIEIVAQNAKEEAVDGIIIYLNIIQKLGISKTEFIKLATMKLEKWDSKHLIDNGAIHSISFNDKTGITHINKD